jgi:pimeloyl-ACP methyl ester carboxylesterase
LKVKVSNKKMLSYKKMGTGPAIVLIHGFPNDGTSWKNILPLLSKNYTYILPDLPGAGASAYIPNLSLEKMAAAVKGILDVEKIDAAIWVGHSMGGYTSMEAAIHFPEKIKAISLVHSLASADSEEKLDTRKKSIKLLQNGDTGKVVFLKAMAENLFDPSFLATNPDAAVLIVANGMRLSTDSLTAFYTAIMNRSDKVEWLKTNHSIPLQWIIGSADNATPMKDAMKQCYLSAVNDVHCYQNVGHMSMMECPEQLAADLNNFFDFVWQNK